MTKKKRWGRKHEDKRNWREYNEELVMRGYFYISPAFLSTWNEEIEQMNTGKVGEPYLYPDSMIEFLAVLSQKFDDRSLEGIMMALSEKNNNFPVISYSQINRRVNALNLDFPVKENKNIIIEEDFVGADASGIKVSNRGEWLRHKWRVQRGWIKVVILGKCVIPKLFHKAVINSPMKLSKSKLTETLRKLADGKTVYQARKVAGISVRRVYQLKEAFDKTGEVPKIGNDVGRPRKPFEEWEITLVKETFEKYRVSADTLERCIDRDCKEHLGHNRIHQILIFLGYAKKKDIRDIRKKKWKRYERRHSLTAVHIDWHYFKGIWVFGVEDDASRKLLALIESEKESTDNSILGMELALKHGPIKQCISDHGSTFISNFAEGESRFKEYLKSKGIKQILCRIKHPQSNGKMEKWFDCYNRNREAFKTKEEFMSWYNDVKPHRALRFDELETPSQAFKRKLRK